MVVNATPTGAPVAAVAGLTLVDLNSIDTLCFVPRSLFKRHSVLEEETLCSRRKCAIL